MKKIPHWYTFEVKMIPILILGVGGLKSIPHSSRTSVYTFIIEVNAPPPRAFLQLSHCSWQGFDTVNGLLFASLSFFVLFKSTSRSFREYMSVNYIHVCILPRGGGGTCHGFGYGCAAGVPGPHPIHIHGKVKKQTHSYTFHNENCTHSYTYFDVKMIPIHILGGLKRIPHSSRTSVYTFIMEVNPHTPHSIHGENPKNPLSELCNTIQYNTNMWERERWYILVMSPSYLMMFSLFIANVNAACSR